MPKDNDPRVAAINGGPDEPDLPIIDRWLADDHEPAIDGNLPPKESSDA